MTPCERNAHHSRAAHRAYCDRTGPTCPNHGTAHERHLDARPPGARYVMRAYVSWSDAEADAPTERHYYATRGEAIAAGAESDCPIVDVLAL